VGGAGGGREAFELVARGYAVTAFEPSPALAGSMADRAVSTAAPVQTLVGRYQDLPSLRTLDGQAVNLEDGPAFDAAILGWSSYSHIRQRADRVAALSAVARLTDGPVCASFFLRGGTATASNPVAAWTARKGLRHEGDRFTPHIGFFHQGTIAEIDAEIAEAGLVRVALSENDGDGYWPWFAAARPTP